MTNKLHSEKTNIDKFPRIIPIEEGHQLTLGDLHGNALKLLHHLVKHEIVVCSVEEYVSFVELYHKDKEELSLEDLSWLRELCQGFTIKNRNKICFLGDCLADRGENDFLTLLLFKKLQEEGVPFEILVSNHDFTFIQGFENGRHFRSNKKSGTREFARSMHQMQDLIEAEILSVGEIEALAFDAYFPNLKLLSYNMVSEDELTYYSHARVDEEVIAYVAQHLGVSFSGESVLELAASIDTINYFFQKHFVEKNIISTLSNELSESKSDPITFLMWNRKYEILQTNLRPYIVNGVHGHDSAGPMIEGVYCLNTNLGYNKAFHRGEYKVLISSCSHQLKALVEEVVEIKKLESRQLQENNFVNYSFARLMSVSGFWGQGSNHSNREITSSNSRCNIS